MKQTSNLSLILKGEDTKRIARSQLLWTRQLESCQIRKGLTFKQNKLEIVWAGATNFHDEYVAAHCSYEPWKHYNNKRRFEINNSFEYKLNITVRRGYTVVSVKRGYVDDF